MVNSMLKMYIHELPFLCYNFLPFGLISSTFIHFFMFLFIPAKFFQVFMVKINEHKRYSIDYNCGKKETLSK